MRQETLRWLEQARVDLETAEFNASGKRSDAAAFFAHQAVEKGLKALYIEKFGKLLKTHDLVLLGKKLGLPEDLINHCKSLSPAYIYTRYPDVEEIKDIEKVSKQLIAEAKKVLEWIEKTV